MPFKSDAQRRLFRAKAERGEISKSKVAEYERKTKGDLPERVGKRKEAKTRAVKYKQNKGS